MLSMLQTYRGLLRITALPLATVFLAGVVLVFVTALREEAPAPAVAPVRLTAIDAVDAGELEKIFAGHDYQWPPDGPVPPLGLQQMPPDMGKLDVDRKKKLFFRTVLPLILAENRRIRRQRTFVSKVLQDYSSLDAPARRHLAEIADEYKVDGDLSQADARRRLLRRVDIVPTALALAQAATESAWGDSRFTVEANSLFGIWTWKKSHGVVPAKREPDASHLVHSYPDLRASVRDYMHNLNAGYAYSDFRKKRAVMRDKDEPLDPLKLAGTLDRYSERGHAYVTEIRHIMLSNDLIHLAPLQLAG